MKERIGIGIIGTGFARKVQIPAFQTVEGAKVVSVASASSVNARSTAEEFGIGHFTTDWRDTASHESVDIVCVTTPPVLHKEMTLFALEHGKHVLCEKPMAMNAAEAQAMVQAAHGKALLALIDHELRFQPGRLKAYEMLRGSVIGKVRHAKYHFQAPHRGDPSLPWNWWSDIEQGGGALGAINSHVIDSFRWFMGAEISEVFCQLQTHIKERPVAGGAKTVTTDDQANMLLRFGPSELTNEATGIVSVSMTEGPAYVNDIEFHGTDGAMKIDFKGDVLIAKRGGTEWTKVDVSLGQPVAGSADTGFSRGFMEFAPRIVEALRTGAMSIEHAATFEDGLMVQRVLDAARESDRIGRVIELSI